MRRYDNPSDAIPHEMNVLVLSESDTCFDSPYETIFDAVRSGLSCDKLLIEEYYHDLVDFPDRELLVQHGIWLVHHDCLVDRTAYPELHHYLATGSYPDGTAVVVCVDEEAPPGLADSLREQYGNRLGIATSHERLVSHLTGFLAAVNPCSRPGLEYIVRWNNGVCDDLKIV